MHISLDTSCMYRHGVYPGRVLCLDIDNRNFLDIYRWEGSPRKKDQIYLVMALGSGIHNTFDSPAGKKLNEHTYSNVLGAAINQHELWPAAVLAILNCKPLIKDLPWLRNLSRHNPKHKD